MFGVKNNHVMMKRKRQGKRNQKEIKVKYISSPMMFKTCASNFRALVQELTGQDSNVAEMFMEIPSDVVGFVHNKGLMQERSEAYLTDYREFDLRSSIDPLNGLMQYDLLSFDML
ncbi:hypothetical protein Lal_00037646 [Lupinus albus]|uniref:Uncharacterized protein n=1 Tax=Lupinus albus TaxID=3870 RepID=A0A6A4NDH3_LUPAL|nr:hypothetical protein Lalb_Chr21g0315251 [Lupinus albus]KAF1860308.1 hypothetical protein Lal_00037646 [Lupinus albus]